MKSDDPRLQPGVYRNHKGLIRRLVRVTKTRTGWPSVHYDSIVPKRAVESWKAEEERHHWCGDEAWFRWLGPAGKWERLPDDWKPSDKPEMTRGELEAALEAANERAARAETSLKTAIVALEGTRWLPFPDMDVWKRSPAGMNHTCVCRALDVLRSAITPPEAP